LKTNDAINLEQIEDKIVISKQVKSKISLAEKFKEYHGENLAKDFSWDDARGREIW
jgi:antitoxin component of MazEF toxin-antitoxin module